MMGENLMPLYNTYLLSIYYTLSSALGAGDTIAKKRDKNSCLIEVINSEQVQYVCFG